MDRFAPVDPPAIVRQAPRKELLRCDCPECRMLDARHPREGFQLSLLRWIALGFRA